MENLTNDDDFELLAFAMFAAGIKPVSVARGRIVIQTPSGKLRRWNPLGSGDDTFCLAVDLDIQLKQRFGFVEATYPCVDLAEGNLYKTLVEKACLDDRCAASKRAVVRAAAEIGKAKVRLSAVQKVQSLFGDTKGDQK